MTMLPTYIGQDQPQQPANGKPAAGDRVKKQSPARRVYTATGSTCNATGANCSIFMGPSNTDDPNKGRAAYPFWRMPLRGTYGVYRMMLNHPTIQLVRSMVTSPIIASYYNIDTKPGAKDNVVKFVQDKIIPLREGFITDALRSLDHGWYPGVPIWNIYDGLWVMDRIKMVLPDNTVIMTDEHGEFAGIKNMDVPFNELESIIFTNDGEPGNLYGRSRLENLRDTAWAAWLQALVEGMRLDSKLSGIIPIVKCPGGGYVADDGTKIVYADEAQKIIENLPQGKGVVIESVAFSADDIRNSPELAKASLVELDFYDAGNVAQAMAGSISRLEYMDKLFFRGYLRGERTGLEAVNAGSRADSESHTDTAITDSELIDTEIARSFKRLVKLNLTMNFGAEQAELVTIRPQPLVDKKLAVFREVVRQLLAVPGLAIDVAKALDVTKILAAMGFPMLKDFIIEAALQPPQPKPGDPNRNTDPAITKQLAESLAVSLWQQLQPYMSAA